jgi:hypothetical protein
VARSRRQLNHLRSSVRPGFVTSGWPEAGLGSARELPVTLFWSVTVYDPDTRSEIQTDQGNAALRSLVELRDVATTGATDLYFGPNAPVGKEGRWIKTTPGKGWFVYLRLYGPEAPAFDGSWKPSDFEEIG